MKVRPIDANAVLADIEALKKSPWFTCNNETYELLVKADAVGAVTDLCIKQAPTLDYSPVKQGEWIEEEGYNGDDFYRCSACGEYWVTIDGTPAENNMRFCPCCGAKMKEDGKDA